MNVWENALIVLETLEHLSLRLELRCIPGGSYNQQRSRSTSDIIKLHKGFYF